MPPSTRRSLTRARAVSLATSLAILSLGGAPRRLAAQRQDGLATVDTALLEVRIGDAATGLGHAYRRRDSTVVELAGILMIAGIDVHEGEPAVVTPAELAARLHADATLDWSGLTLVVADSGTLPVSRRAARSRARAALLTRSGPQVAAPPARARRLPTSVALDYAVSRDAGVTLSIGSRAIGGAVDVAIDGLGVRSVDHLRAAWESIVPGAVAAPRWRLGTIDEIGGRPGIRLTNVPVTLIDSIGVVALRTTTSPGSDVDVFVDGALVTTDTARADGVAHLNVPDRVGAHDVRVVGYAADGSTRLLTWRRIVTPDALLPARALRYTAAVAPCIRVKCAGVAGGVAFAPITGITIGAALRPRATGGSERTMSLDARMPDGIVLAARAVLASGSRVELYRDRGNGSGIALRSISTPTRGRATSLSGEWRVATDAFAHAEVAHDGGAWRASGSATFSTRLGTVMPTVTVVDGAGAPARAICGVDALLVGGWLPDVMGALRRGLVRAHAGSAAANGSAQVLTLVYPASPRLSVEASVAWMGDASPRRRVVSIALRRRLPRATLRVSAQQGGIVPVEREEVSGSVVLDAARRRVAASADPLAGRAGVHGRVFIDRDRDGRFGVGDEPLAGVAVRIGGTAALSDPDGGFEAWDLAPYRRALVEVDSLSIDVERLEPPRVVSVQPTPHALVWIDVPIRARARKDGGA